MKWISLGESEFGRLVCGVEFVIYVASATILVNDHFGLSVLRLQINLVNVPMDLSTAD